MEKILIITRAFPPLNLVASSRPLSWANYLAKQGYEVHVLTTKKEAFCGTLDYFPEIRPEIRIHEVDWPFKPKSETSESKYHRKLRRFALSFTFAKKALALQTKYSFDVVISTFEPAASHYAAAKIKRNDKNIYWIADYRDPWSSNHLDANRKPFRSKISRFFERKIVRNADLITTVSEGMVQNLSTIHPDHQFAVIYNGFEKEFNSNKSKSNDLFTISYTGTIYPDYQRPEILFEAFQILLKKHPSCANKLKFQIFGSSYVPLEPLIQKYKVGRIVELCGRVSRDEAVQHQESADLLIFLDWDSGENGVLTGKLFEYIRTRTPILSIGPPESDVVNILEQTNTGISFGKNTEKISSFIKKLIDKSANLSWFSPNEDEINLFHRNNQAKKLEEIILQRRREDEASS